MERKKFLCRFRGIKMKNKKEYLNIIKIVVIWGLATLTSLILDNFQIRVENILLIYVVGIVISIIETSNIAWGIISAITFVMTFNFLYTEPRYTFMINDPNYLISLFIFITVAVIVSTLTNRLQKQREIALHQEEVTSKINHISSGFLNLSGYDEIKEYCQESLFNLTKINNEVFLYKNQEFNDKMAWWCYCHGESCGKGQAKYSSLKEVYLPIQKDNHTYGTVKFDCSNQDISYEDLVYIKTIISELILVLQRDDLTSEKEEARLQVEREKLKSTLLRSISHDLRTPLTSVAGGANFLVNNIELIEKKTCKNILKDISKEALRLNGMVENLLNMTRIQEGNFKINKKMEVVDDIISTTVSAITNRKESHDLVVEGTEDIILFPCDAQLIVQVLVNVLDNAFKHTPDKTKVILKVFLQNKKIIFQVIDNGKGIEQDKLAHIFDDFFTTNIDKGDHKRGIGLGLAICKAIIGAHNGRIIAFNNSLGGATFEISLPLEDKGNE